MSQRSLYYLLLNTENLESRKRFIFRFQNFERHNCTITRKWRMRLLRAWNRKNNGGHIFLFLGSRSDRMLRCFATFYRLKINVSKLCHAFVSEGDTSWTLSNDRTEKTADNSIARQILVTRQVTKFSSFPLHLPTSLIWAGI